MKLPFFKFFPSDWLSDERLRTVSIEARGLWIDLVAFAWKAERKGYVELVRGTPLSNDAIARVVGGSVEQVVRLLAELEGACVFSREAETNVIFSRRIVDDVAALQRSSAAGKMGGGNPLLKGGHKGGYKAPSKPQKSEVRSQKSDKEGVASARPTLADWLAEAKARFPEWPTADAEAAWHHYEGNGWRTGKNPVRRWQSCVVTCHARWAKYPRSTPRPEPVQRYLPANLRPGANDE